jgi:hypothetical protein
VRFIFLIHMLLPTSLPRIICVLQMAKETVFKHMLICGLANCRVMLLFTSVDMTYFKWF